MSVNSLYFAALLLLPALYGGEDGCYADIQTFDAEGKRVPVTITAVRPVNSTDRQINLLTYKAPGFRMEVRPAQPQRIYFSGMKSPAMDLLLTVRDRAGNESSHTIWIMGCQSQIAISVKENTTWADIAFTTITGELKGCKFSSDWWVRAFPMFGNQDAFVCQGTVETSGKFIIPGVKQGIRHVVVIGHGAKPVKTLAINIELDGKPNNLGIVDLSKDCTQ